MNNLISRVRINDLPANCEEAKLHLKNGRVRSGYLVKTKSESPFHFFICNRKLVKRNGADIELISRDLVSRIDLCA